ncbi:transcriptional regulator, GntR family [Saccharopolyspora kobensis]|uniref:DNA-binding transcriptional regulator, FadR family n=1 Tax=Saccharopolyspora kobensis TaxID=146035 RepID=A0A1H6DBV2_9PSEU|nr:FadR/GntR family transcriptional regulator [Saccharopolyspora kobensis]SEG82313.1 transcriptional regulator, GntR family [Saccharopolyspora kobensis]SFE24111.1 DNA-binding transcriptional regulator, FadR family [Saccharopolyspora kobensis]
MSLRRYPLSEQATEAMLQRIAGGDWPVGGKIPSETALAAEFGVGRSTVREAVRELAGRGVLEPRHGSGVYVIRTEAVEDWPTTVRKAVISEVVEGRIAVEVEAARLAATKRTADDLVAIERAIARRSELQDGTPEEFVDADIAFHRAVVDAAHNTIITGLFDSLTERVREAMLDVLALLPEPRPVDHAEHHEIVAAITGGDPEEAARTARAHLEQLLAHVAPPRS